MSGAVAFVFGLCALSFAAGCVLTAYMLRREPEPEAPPAVAPEPPPVELKLDVVWPPEDYATKPIHRNPVLGLPVMERPAEPARPALSLVPDLQPVVEESEPRPLEAVPEPADDPEPAAEPADEPAAGVEAEPVPEPVVPEPIVVAVPAQPEPVVVELPEREPVAEAPARPEPVVVEPPGPEAVAEGPARPEPVVPAQPVQLPDPTEFRQRYLRSFEQARRRTSR
ncbi:hypothetical protein AB0A74_33275 [Saccharothrix sp. NPDC042600]|uniref:hypothetical protein n=1 Tax=Saccharothrix TaxID=2071 RepID=UPI0033CFCBB6|nr:hypothetical protein GCM10017745_20270 [Saccharothrix mutabilis subsp. capreolus]